MAPDTKSCDQAWFGPDMALRKTEWTHHFSKAEIDELHRATDAALAVDEDLINLRAEHFPLLGCKSLLERVRQDLLQGRGFCLFRGIPVDSWSREEVAGCFWGLGAHLGVAVSQNGKGHVLGHVTDLGLD